jgi:hypothetical protein
MAREQAKNGDGVLKPRKPLPRTGIKKNQGTTTLTKPKIIPFKIEALHIPYFNNIKKNIEYIIATV